MPEVRPFRAVRYNPRTVPDLAAVLAPPYDIVSENEHQQLLDRDPHNVVRLTLGDRSDPTAWHAQAAARLDDWLRRRVLVHDGRPGFYVYTQTFDLPGQGRRTRTAVLGMVRLYDFDAGEVYPHEHTLSGPKEDRLKLMRATHFNLSPIFSVYTPDETSAQVLRAAAHDSPVAEATDSAAVVHRLWHLTDEDSCGALAESFSRRPVYIADGHHRYETALAFQREQLDTGTEPDSPVNYVLMALVATDDPGLTILPAHRVVQLPPGAEVDELLNVLTQEAHLEPVPAPAGCLPSAVTELTACTGGYAQFGVYVGGGRWYRLRLERPEAGSPVERLPVTLLQDRVLQPHVALGTAELDAAERIRYTHDPAQAVEWVDTGAGDVAFCLPPPAIEEVQAVANAGRCMPQKGTYFYPKLITGLVLADLREW